MIMKVAGLPLHETSAYRLGDVLVDAGAPTTAGPLIAHLRRHPVREVVVTHHHEDHAGGGADIAAELGIPVMAPAGAVPIIASGPRLPLYRRVLSTLPRPYRAEPLGGSVDCGRYRLEVIPTPGHTFDHVCFFEPEHRWLFTGDLFVHERVPVLRRIEDVWEHVRSLERVAALSPALLACSQAGFVEDGTAALERKIVYWERLAAEAQRLQRRGLSIPRIRRRLLGREGLFTYVSFGEFSKRRLVESLLERS
jgi:glyoxylase-like metal-dependent hydrolase (beta-lactamase superfamily II)